MRPLIASMFTTLEGVMEAPGGEPTHPHTGWVGDLFSPQIGAYKQQEVFDADTLLIGRVTYESFAGAWPDYEGDMADRMNSMEKIVVSNTLTAPAWTNSSVLSGDTDAVVAAIAALRASDGAPILLAGSGQLLHTLLDHGQVDELRLMVFPVTIGHGLRVFPDTRNKTTWRHTGSIAFPADVRVDTYHPA